ncbi:hypothetical protein BH10PSE18_BH10PSE18_04070 [soil metagenome]
MSHAMHTHDALRRLTHFRETTDMTHPKPSPNDPSQLPVEPEFPTDEHGDKPNSEEGEPGLDENAAGFVKPKL